MNKKILLIIILLFICLIGNTYAYDKNSSILPINDIVSSSNNTKIYDDSTNTMTIKSPIGLTDYATIQLLTPKRMQVGAGYQKVAEFEVNSKVNYDNFFNSMYFYDLKNKSNPIKRSFDLREEINYLTDENTYKEICGLPKDINGELTCKDELTGKIQVNKTRYDLFDANTFFIGKKKLSLWTNVEMWDSIEWVPDIFGVAIKEWAAWDYDLDLNLVAWYSFDSNNAHDSKNTYDLDENNVSAANYEAGLIGRDFNTLANPATHLGSYLTTTSVPATDLNARKTGAITFWFKSSVVNTISLSYVEWANFARTNLLDLYDTSTTVSWRRYDGTANATTLTTPATLNDGAWHFVYLAYDGSNLSKSLDGAGQNGTASTKTLNIQKLAIGSNVVGTEAVNGVFDEIGVWDRKLSDAEISYLYNGGLGTTYCGMSDVNAFDDVCTLNTIKIDFNVYIAGTSTHLTDINFNCTNSSLDLVNQNSPFSSTANGGTTSNCTFSKALYDSNVQTITYDTNKTQVIYLTLTPPPQARITWNIYRTGTTSHLTGVTADCNVNTMDFVNQNSPITDALVDQNTVYDCNFVRAGYADNNGNIGVVDSNKTVTIYLTDSTNPVVGTTTISGFTVVGTQIWGTGDIKATATDLGSDINSTGCYYTINNGTNWALADHNSTHCYKNGLTVTAGTTPQYNLKAIDNAGNTGTGTASTAYTADNVKPVTTFAGATGSWQKTTLSLTLSCADATSGCASTKYRINSGTWTTYAGAFGVSDGNNQIDYNSTDAAGNVEVTLTNYAAQDRVNPTTSIGGCNAGWNTTNRTVEVTATDATSGLSNIYLWDSNGTYRTGTTSPLSYTISTDGNHTLTYQSKDVATNLDTNKTYYCAIDKTNPTTGQTLMSGFTTYTTYIKGIGNIQATASDATSGLASCQYTINGTDWLSADVNTTHCYKNTITIIDGTTYHFNLRAIDNASNTGTGTAIATTYTGDTLSPTTTITFTDYNNLPYKFIHATCTDNNAGCKGITFEFDSNGTKFYNLGANFDWNYFGLGHHTLKYYSTDNLDQNETLILTDLNMPVLLTIKYPKNIATLAQLSEKWILRSTGGVIVNLTDLTTDQNVYVLPNILTTFYVGDVNGNYTQATFTKTYYFDSNTGYDTYQPYLYSIATSLATTINVLNTNTLVAIPNVTIKFYGNLPGLGNTLIGQGTTDSKGQILQLFIAGQNYVFDVYYQGTLRQTYNYTALNTSTYIYFNFLTLDNNNLPIIPVIVTNDMNTATMNFYDVRNTLFNTCTATDPCFPSALWSIILTIIALITATTVTQGAFVGVKGLSIIAFCCFTLFFGIGWLPIFIYAFLGSITVLMAVLVQ